MRFKLALIELASAMDFVKAAGWTERAAELLAPAGAGDGGLPPAEGEGGAAAEVNPVWVTTLSNPADDQQGEEDGHIPCG